MKLVFTKGSSQKVGVQLHTRFLRPCLLFLLLAKKLYYQLSTFVTKFFLSEQCHSAHSFVSFFKKLLCDLASWRLFILQGFHHHYCLAALHLRQYFPTKVCLSLCLSVCPSRNKKSHWHRKYCKKSCQINFKGKRNTFKVKLSPLQCWTRQS